MTVHPFSDRLNRLLAPKPEDLYAKELASWQIEHDADRRDMTEPQRTRALWALPALQQGLDVHALHFVWLLVEAGVISDHTTEIRE